MKTLCFFLIAALATPSLAQDVTMVTPVFSQLVATPLPAGFKPAFENTLDGRYILEAVPEAETLDNWSQMLTLTGAKDAGGAQGTALVMANAIADGYRNACPDRLVTETLQAPFIPGAVDVFAAFLGCTAIPDRQPEAMVVLIMAGARDLYTLQWAARAPASDAPVTYDMADWTPRLAQLAAGTRICEIVAGEPAPYPSCVGN